MGSDAPCLLRLSRSSIAAPIHLLHAAHPLAACCAAFPLAVACSMRRVQPWSEPGRCQQDTWPSWIEDRMARIQRCGDHDPCCRAQGPHYTRLWDLALGSRLWDLALGSGSGIWALGSGTWDLGPGIWGLGSGVWGLGSCKFATRRMRVCRTTQQSVRPCPQKCSHS